MFCGMIQKYLLLLCLIPLCNFLASADPLESEHFRVLGNYYCLQSKILFHGRCYYKLKRKIKPIWFIFWFICLGLSCGITGVWFFLNFHAILVFENFLYEYLIWYNPTMNFLSPVLSNFKIKDSYTLINICICVHLYMCLYVSYICMYSCVFL